MAWLERFGTVPIAGRVFNVPPTSVLFSNGWDAYRAVVPVDGSSSDQAIFFQNHGVEVGTIGDGLIGRNLSSFHFTTKDSSAHPSTTLNVYCQGKHSSFGSDVWDIAYKQNTALGLNTDLNCGGTGILGAKVYAIAIAMYTGPEAVTLNSVGVYYAAFTPGVYTDFINLDVSYSYNRISLIAIDAMGYNAGLSDEDPDIGPASEEEGYGQDGTTPGWNHTSDIVGIPDMPSIGVLTAGFYHAYKVSQGDLTNFGAKLFPTLGNIVGSLAPFSTVQEAMSYFAALIFQPGAVQGITIANQTISIADMIMNGKAIDYVIDCHVIPVSPTVGASQNIKCGARELDIAVPTCASDYIDFDCGTISTALQYQNFMDLQGVRCRLFLPFVGFTEIEPEYWNGGTVGVKYRFNIVDGSFMCYVYATSAFSRLENTVIGQFGGSACLHIPVTGLNYASMVSGLITGSMSLVGSVASGNAPGAAGSAVNMLNMSPDAAQSNNYNSSTSFLGVRQPYMLLEYAVPSMSMKYQHDKGFPLNVTHTIQEMVGTGYTEIEDIDLSGLDATKDEIDELRTLLAGGVYL